MHIVDIMPGGKQDHLRVRNVPHEKGNPHDDEIVIDDPVNIIATSIPGALGGGTHTFDDRRIFRVVNRIGPFVRIFGCIVEFLLPLYIANVASHFVADADVRIPRRPALTRQPGDRGALPRCLRVS